MTFHKQGFSLIEILVVIAIVAILAALSIPAYLDYTVRTRVSEGINLASSAQIAVAESTLANNQLPENQLETGYNTPPATENVSSITIAGDGTGTITISLTPKAGNGTIILVPTFANQSITWQCRGGTLQSKYRPPVCR